MPKKPKKPQPVDLWTIHKCECWNCHDTIIVGGDPKEGDSICCERCSATMTVQDICSEYREGDEPTLLETLRQF